MYTFHLFIGDMTPDIQIPLFTMKPLVVDKIHKKVGDTVQKGEKIISLDPSWAEKQLKQAENTVAQLDHTLFQVKRLNTIVEQNVSTFKQLEKEFENSLQNLKQRIHKLELMTENNPTTQLLQSTVELLIHQAELSKAANSVTPPAPSVEITEIEMQLLQAKEQVEMAKKTLNETVITSPIDGVISQINVSEQQTALPNTPLAVVMNDQSMKATFQLTSFQINKIHPDMEVVINVDGINEKFKGIVKTLSPATLPQTNLFTMEVAIPNEEHAIKSGMRAVATIQSKVVTGAFVIPVDSIIYDEDGTYVFISNNDSVRRQTVSLGAGNGEVIEVLTGVKEGDEIITRGKERLTENSKIINKASD
ncbi:efflux RND transporter periplasmic adaptor subunit [Anaerobacillus sp. MEB173]|uniref:efflux RND transporter periplasmic adaptor subunit n=1 Tax=Anaerobacillus sp. MEB173 TaxID=3383345 RepID=UPI003F9272A7